jgi:hypothetical protein
MLKAVSSLKVCLLLALLLAQLPRVCPAQDGSPAPRVAELARLRDQLKVTDAWRAADVLLVVNETAVAEAAQQLIGMQFILANGTQLRLDSIALELKTAEAQFKLGVEARPAGKLAPKLNLQLTGSLGCAEINGAKLRAPFRVTEVRVANGILSPLWRVLFGPWIAPSKWNAALPAIELPRELAETINIPANRFTVAGEMPMELATTAYQLPVKFTLAALALLDKRLIVALNLPGREAVNQSASETTSGDETALVNEIEQLGASLAGDNHIRVRVSRAVIGDLLARLAGANANDLRAQLKPARIRAEETGIGLRITNYTDVESGEGSADLRTLTLERIGDGRLEARLNVQGRFTARLRGREYGLPYRLLPHGTFAINDRLVPLQFASEGEKVFLAAAPGTPLPIEARLNFTIARREIGFNRKLDLPAERLFKRIEVPALIVHEVPLPRRVEVNKAGALSVTRRGALGLQLAQIRLNASAEMVEISAGLAFHAQ